MFDFLKSKSTLAPITVLPVQTDIHSHILPGIDDGSPDIATSLKLVKGIYDLGIRKTVATPHIIGDLYRNTPSTIGAALSNLQQACKEHAIDIEIKAAAEYMLDDHFSELLSQPAPLLTIHNNIILTEQSFAAPSVNLHELAFEMVTKGYRPIMAHPERYGYYHDYFDAFSQLKDMGFLLQINILSLTGHYGKATAKAAKYILSNNLADLVGTDMHHEGHLKMMQDEKHLRLFDEYLGDKKFNQLEAI